MSQVFICNFDNKAGAFCHDGCRHPKILYVPMAAGFRCDDCHTYQRDDLQRGAGRAFHDQHAGCGAKAARS